MNNQLNILPQRRARMLSNLTAFIEKTPYAALAAMLGYIGGETLLNKGVAVAVVAAIATIIVEYIRAVVTLRQTNDQRALRFIQRQIIYHQACDTTNRNRLHAMQNELQRAILHIRNCETAIRDSSCELRIPEFTVRTFGEIVEEFPLPEPPHFAEQVNASLTK